MKSVAILGCGPAGLLVAHAAEISGWDFRIYSKKQKSKLYGAQYLHQAIPQLDCGPPAIVKYALRGTPEEYRHKVYGATWDGTVSPEDFIEEHYAWDIRLTYDTLWDRYQEQIVDVDITARVFTRSSHALWWHDLVISTVPRKLWAEPGDVFESTKVWALGDTDDNERVRMYRPPDNSVVCDGTQDHDWYRVSNIFGFCTMEWPFKTFTINDLYNGDPIPPARGASIVEKPLRHNSKAAADFVHVGRYGSWEKGKLTTDAFFDACKALANDSI